MAFANVNVTVTEPNVTVSSDNVNVTVGTTVSNVTVGNATVVSNADVRSKISVQNVSGFGSLAYDSSITSNGIIQYTGVTNAQVISTLSGGNGIDVNPTGEIAVDSSVVRVDQTKTGNVAFTGNVTGAYILGDGSQLTGIDSNADVKAYIESTGLNATANLTTTANVDAASFTTTGNATIGGNLNVAGDLEVTGNINYREVEDLLVQDQTITLNYGNASAQNAQIIVDRQGSGLANVDLKWNETTDEWQFTNDGSTYNNLGETTGNASGLSKAVTSPAIGDGIVKWTDHGDGTGNWQANYQTGNVTTNPIHNIVLEGSSNTFLQAAANVSWGLPALTTDIGKNDTYPGSAPSQLFLRDRLYTNGITCYDTSDGQLKINDGGGTEDAIDINITLRTTNDAGTLNSSGMAIYGNQGATGPGTGSKRPIVSYDGMGNVHTWLDEAGINNANTNTNHFTIYGNGIFDPVFKVEQNSDITIGGVTTSDSNIITTANITGSYIFGDGSQLTNIPYPADAVTSVNTLTGVVVLNTGDLQESGNLFYTDVRSRSALSTTTASAVSGGSLAYDSATGVFTFAPSTGIDLNELSVTTASASGGGSLTYDDTSGVFTFAPAVDNVQAELGTGNIYVGSANVTTQVTPSDNFSTSTTTTGSTALTITTIIPNLNQYPGSGPNTYADTVALDGQTGSGFDTTAVTIAGIVDTGATQLNGNTYYAKWDVGNSAYGLYTAADLLTPVQVCTATGFIGAPGGSPTATYSSAPITVAEFNLSNTISNVNSITAETGSNITLSTTGQVVAGNITVDNISAPGTDNLVLKGEKIEFKQIIDGTSQQYANVSASGYKLLSFSSAPTDVGTLLFEAYGMGGTAVAGSPVFTVGNIGSIREIINNNGYSAGSTDGQNRLGQLVAGQVLTSFSSGSFPFPSGTRLVSVNAGANQITLSQNAIDSATLSTGYGALNGLIISDGAYNDTTGAQFAFISEYQVLGAGSNANISISNFINSNEHEEGYLFAKTGPALADLTYTKGTSANYTGMAFNTQGQFEFSGNEAFQTSELGTVIGSGGTLTEKMDVDNIPSFGQNIFWSGENNLQDNYGVAPFAASPLYSSFASNQVQVTPTIGIKSYTANTTQATTPAIGPRLSFTSQNGKASDNPYDTYPLEGQELGRIQWNATRSNRLTSDNTKSPAYISSVARNFVTKEEADFYIVGSSEFSNLYREPFLSYEKGNLILASGTQSGAYQPITFAPAQAAGGSGSTPAGTYDFNADGNPSWLAVNYANVTTSKGAKTTVTNGGTYGQTATGDLQLGINRVKLPDAPATDYTTTGGFLASGDNFGGTQSQPYILINGSPPNGALVEIVAATGDLSGANGNNYYIQLQSGPYYKLWDDAALTVAADMSDFGFSGYILVYNMDGAVIRINNTNDVVAKEWLFDLNKDSDNLLLTDNGVTKVTFTDTTSIFSSRVRFQSFTTTEINALASPQAGDTVFNTTLADICFYDGSAWQKVNKATM